MASRGVAGYALGGRSGCPSGLRGAVVHGEVEAQGTKLACGYGRSGGQPRERSAERARLRGGCPSAAWRTARGAQGVQGAQFPTVPTGPPPAEIFGYFGPE